MSSLDEIVLMHARTLELTHISCDRLASRGVDLANHLGYEAGGIDKGSQAARAMSTEAKMCGGLLNSMELGGICASLQSIGAFGAIKPKACENIRRVLQELGKLRSNEYLVDNGSSDGRTLLVVQMPPYFSAATLQSPPLLQDDYRLGGYNYRMAEAMLNESILPFCKENPSRCCLNPSSKFEVIKFERLENVALFNRYKTYETSVARTMHRTGRGPTSGEVSPLHTLPIWLQKLSNKNGLASSAHTVYLLHGTKSCNVKHIVQDGLKTKFSLGHQHLTYGQGLYFTDNACKASQYTDDGCMLICRVVLGRTEVLRKRCSPKRKLFPSIGHDSAMAKRNLTASPSRYPQLHNEYIIFDECACYPEFVVKFKIRS